MTLDVTLGMALLAGIISFLSPCVLPLVPPYLCFITGASLEQLSEREGSMAVQRRRTLLAALFFVLGFSTVFILMGVSASYVGQLLRAWLPVLAQVAGVFIILMGLNFLGVFKLGFLSREKRYHAETRPAGLIGAYGVGLAFAFGWTPCIGPVLAMILTLAATEQDMARGAGLLAVYSAGLGIPFLLAAAGIGTFLGFFRRFRSQMRNVERAMGLLLVLTGVMFLTGYMQAFSYWLIEQFPWLATIG
ncbi:MAG: cytochrome c biogenesis protein CcdA [Alphaproteobacteria bacterium]|jgi:cytochrome c-type biogenesis protein|nr:cytochrome c biogenesis protein CcdA [Alphaproteobacteria bacterium]